MNLIELYLFALIELYLLVLIELYLFAFNFTTLKQKKIVKFLKKKYFKLINQNKILSNIQIFNSRFIDEIKNQNTKNFFEKSQFVIQTYNDFIKKLILTQFFTIQRINQRVI